jgi:antitoxin component of MazEF toxin-antitoxin module
LYYHRPKGATVIKKLVRHGNSRALVIEKPILELLNIDDDTEIEIITDGDALIMRPLRPGTIRREAFEAALESANRDWGSALKRLAE